MRTREARLPDAERVHDLIGAYSGDGTLLPRSLAEVCENVRDFVVLEDHGRIVGCGALHLYGPHLAEIRSITVHPSRQRSGGGASLVKALLAQARKHKVSCICLFTRIPDFFARMGFAMAQREDLLTRSIKIAGYVPGSIAVTRSPWCVANCPSSLFFLSPPVGW
jgi:amino-acid N-acetyltransferase